MELIELNQAIEDAKAFYEIAKSNEEALYYKTIHEDLRYEKKEQLKKII